MLNTNGVFSFHETQKVVARDTHRFRVCCHGRRWGKTTLAAWEMFGKAVSKDDRRICYVAPTHQQARDICWEMLKRICLPLAQNVNETRLEITVKTKDGGQSIIYLRGWESVETLRGQRFDFIVIDEVAMMRNFWVAYREVIRPTLTDTKGEVLFISTPKGFNHFYDLYNFQEKDKDYKSFHYTSYDNPHLPKEEIDKAKSDSNFEQEYLADFRKAEGLVYKEFQRDLHIFEHEPTNIVETIAGVDFGYTNPTAIISIKKDFDSNYFVVGEWYRTGKTTLEIAEYAKTLGVNTFYPDPESPEHIEALKRLGLSVREVNKDVEKGIDSVRTLFKNNKLKIHRTCQQLISELETYHYEDSKPDRNEPERPVKDKDHGLDALRYALFMAEPKQETNQQEEFNLYSQATYF